MSTLALDRVTTVILLRVQVFSWACPARCFYLEGVGQAVIWVCPDSPSELVEVSLPYLVGVGRAVVLVYPASPSELIEVSGFQCPGQLPKVGDLPPIHDVQLQVVASPLVATRMGRGRIWLRLAGRRIFSTTVGHAG